MKEKYNEIYKFIEKLGWSSAYVVKNRKYYKVFIWPNYDYPYESWVKGKTLEELRKNIEKTVNEINKKYERSNR